MKLLASHINAVIDSLGYGGLVDVREVALPKVPTLNDIVEVGVALSIDPQDVIKHAVDFHKDGKIDLSFITGKNFADILDSISDRQPGNGQPLIKSTRVTYALWLLWIGRDMAIAYTLSGFAREYNTVDGVMKKKNPYLQRPNRRVYLFCDIAKEGAEGFQRLLYAPFQDAVVYLAMNKEYASWKGLCDYVDEEESLARAGVL